MGHHVTLPVMSDLPAGSSRGWSGIVAVAWVLALGLTLLASPARALELHSFIDDECHVTTGLLVRVDEESVRFIGLDGRAGSLALAKIRLLAIHKVLENPLAQVTMDAGLAGLTREIRTGEGEGTTFVGWPVGFYDQLVIFFDVQGRSHVLEPRDIRSLRPVSGLPAVLTPPAFAKVALDFPPELFLCSLPRNETGVRPSRVLGDRIKVDDYLARLRDRYAALDSFEERTHVYPRPFVFDPINRLGLTYLSGSSGAFIKYVPLYFQWSSGRPYRFQSKSTVGVAMSPWLPIVQPTLSFQSDVKSHFFTATFVGHLPSLPAGAAAFHNLEEAFYPQGSTPAVDESYNYLMLMGGDLGPLSVSGGVMYRSLRVAFAAGVRREISADTMSPVARVMWIGQHARVRAMYFRTRQERENGEGWRLLYDGYLSSEPTQPRYALSLDSVRAGVDLDLPYDLSLSADQVLGFGSYRETGLGSIDIVHAVSSLAVTAQFSRYVATKAYFNLLHRRYDIARDAAAPTSITAGPLTRSNLQIGGALEFLF
jgi:hypothetical protein